MLSQHLQSEFSLEAKRLFAQILTNRRALGFMTHWEIPLSRWLDTNSNLTLPQLPEDFTQVRVCEPGRLE